MNKKEAKVGVCIFAENMDTMVKFYRDTLGFHATWDYEDFAEFETASGYLSLFMYSKKAFAQAINENYVSQKGTNLTFELALWLPSYADVDVEYERLLKLGVQLLGEPITPDHGVRSFFAIDPEGNLLEIGSTNKS